MQQKILLTMSSLVFKMKVCLHKLQKLLQFIEKMIKDIRLTRVQRSWKVWLFSSWTNWLSLTMKSKVRMHLLELILRSSSVKRWELKTKKSGPCKRSFRTWSDFILLLKDRAYLKPFNCNSWKRFFHSDPKMVLILKSTSETISICLKSTSSAFF